jgi:hypothetical protein
VGRMIVVVKGWLRRVNVELVIVKDKVTNDR